MSWITDKLKAMFAAKYVFSIARQLAAFLGGFLVAVPGLNPEDIVSFTESTGKILAGVALWAVAQGFSFADKKNQE